MKTILNVLTFGLYKEVQELKEFKSEIENTVHAIGRLVDDIDERDYKDSDDIYDMIQDALDSADDFVLKDDIENMIQEVLDNQKE
tara:strand:+ start:636 stop:890 length:255 start_codon:yes stop_codon:yes gene_type:complete